MSERMTSIELPGGFGPGIADYGRKTVDEMIAMFRLHAKEMRIEADAILAAEDGDFRICTYRGPLVHRDLTVLQPGKLF